jgi:hypothetical protein
LNREFGVFRRETRRAEEAYLEYGDEVQRRIAAKDAEFVR